MSVDKDSNVYSGILEIVIKTVIKELDKSHLQLKILRGLEKKPLYKQELKRELKQKHYKNLHEALKKLEEMELIKTTKEYNSKGQPVKVTLTPLYKAFKPHLQETYKKHGLA